MHLVLIIKVLFSVFIHANTNNHLYLSKTRIATFSPILSDDRITPFSFTSTDYYVDAYEDGKPTEYLYSKQPHMGVQEPFGGNPSGKVDFTFKEADEFTRYFKLESKHVGDFFFLKISYSYNADFRAIKNSRFDFKVEALFTSTSNSNSNFVQLRNTTNIHIDVRDLNNNCPTFRQPEYTFNVREDISLLSSIGRITAKDLDKGFNSQIFFILDETDQVPFYLNPYSGELFPTRTLVLPRNRNQSVFSTVFPPIHVNKNMYELQAKVAHRGDSFIDCSNIQSVKITVNILSVNNHPPMISLTNSAEDNNSLATINVYDPSENSQTKILILPFSMNTYFELEPVVNINDPNSQAYLLKMRKLDHVISAKLKVSLKLVAVDNYKNIQRSLTAREEMIDDLVSLKSIKEVEVDLVDDKSIKYYTDSGLEFQISEKTQVNSLIGIIRGRQNLPINNYVSLFSDLSPVWNGFINLTQSGALYLTKKIDLERDNTTELLIKFSLGNKNNIVLSSFMENVIRIKVLDFNEFPPIIKNNGSTFQIREDVKIGHVVFDVDAFDPDVSNTQLTYVLLNEDVLPFRFDPIDKKSLVVKESLNAEVMPRSFKIYIEVSDSGSPYPRNSIGLFNIEIEDIDEFKPTFLYPSCTLKLGVNDNGLVMGLKSDNGEELMDLGIYSAQDIDRDGSKFIQSTIKSTNIVRPCFKINSMTNSLILTCSTLSPPDSIIEIILEHSSDQKEDNLIIKVELVKTNQHHFSKNCDKSPVLNALEANSIAKNKLISLVDKRTMDIHSSFGRILFFPTNNYAPKFLHEPKIYLNIPENLPIGTKIYTINAIDNDSAEFSSNGLMQFSIKNVKAVYAEPHTEILFGNDEISEKISIPFLLQDCSNNNNQSSIVISEKGNVNLIIGETIDRDLVSSLEIEVQVCDMADDPKCDQLTFIILIFDLNDEKPIITSPGHHLIPSTTDVHHFEGILFVKENMTINSFVGQITAYDRDIFSQLHFQLVNYRDIFHIDEKSGKIILISQLDREQVDHYDLNILVTDIGYYNHSGVDQNLLKLAKKSEINQQTTDLIVRVQIDDSDDNPVVLDKIDDLVIPSDLPNGAYVTTVRAKDPDIGMNAYTKYFLINNHGNCFTCDHSSGVIIISKTCQGLIENHTYNLTVKATNQASNHERAEITFRVTVLPVILNNYPPKFVDESGLYLALVRENSPPGTVPSQINTDLFQLMGPLKIKAIDPDNRANISYSIVAGTGLGKFSIDESGLITTTVQLDAETTSYVRGYWLTILAKEIIHNSNEYQIYSQDDEKSIAFAEVFIKVLDLNDHAIMTDRPVYEIHIPENTKPNTFISVPELIDRNRDQKSYEFKIISGNDNAWFSIDSEIGLIKTSGIKLDRENLTNSQSDSIQLVVQASEKIDPKTEKLSEIDMVTYHVNIIITDINDNRPEFFNLNHETNSLTIQFYPNENTKCIGRVFALDLDNGINGTVFYGNSESSILSINEKSGAICYNPQASIDQRFNNYTLQAFAKDSQGLKSDMIRVVINLLPTVNERTEIYFENPQLGNITYKPKGHNHGKGTVIHNFSVITKLDSLSAVVCYFDDNFEGPLMILPQGVHITKSGTKSNHFGIILVSDDQLPEILDVFMICTNGHSTSIHQNFTITTYELSNLKPVSIAVDKNSIDVDWKVHQFGLSSRLLWKNHNAVLEVKIDENFPEENAILRVPLTVSPKLLEGENEDGLGIIVKSFDVSKAISFKLNDKKDELIIDKFENIDFERCSEYNYLVIIGSEKSLDQYPTVNLDKIAFLSINLNVEPINEFYPNFHCYNVMNIIPNKNNSSSRKISESTLVSNPSTLSNDYCYTFSIPFNAKEGSFIGQIAASDMDKTLNFSNYLLTGILPIRYNLSTSFPYFRIDEVTGEIYSTVTFSTIQLERYSFDLLITAYDIDHDDSVHLTSVFVHVQLSPGPGSVIPTNLNGFKQSDILLKTYQNSSIGTEVGNLQDYLINRKLLLEKFILLNRTSEVINLFEDSGRIIIGKTIESSEDIHLFVEINQNLAVELITKNIIKITVRILPVQKAISNQFISARFHGRIKRNSPLGTPILDKNTDSVLRIPLSADISRINNYQIIKSSSSQNIPFEINQVSGVIFLNETLHDTLRKEFFIHILDERSSRSLVEVIIDTEDVDDSSPEFTEDANYICTLSLPAYTQMEICQVAVKSNGKNVRYYFHNSDKFVEWLHLDEQSGRINVIDATKLNDNPQHVFELQVTVINNFGYKSIANLTVHITRSSKYEENRNKLKLSEFPSINAQELLLKQKQIKILNSPEGSINKFYLLKHNEVISLDPFKGILSLKENCHNENKIDLPFLVKNSQGFWIQSTIHITDLKNNQITKENNDLEPQFEYLCFGNSTQCKKSISPKIDSLNFVYELLEIFPRSWSSYFHINSDNGTIYFTGGQQSNINFVGKVAHLLVKMSKKDIHYKKSVFISWLADEGIAFDEPFLVIEPNKIEDFHQIKAKNSNNVIYNILPSRLVRNPKDFLKILKDYLSSLKTYFLIPNYAIMSRENDEIASMRHIVSFDIGAKSGTLSAFVEENINYQQGIIHGLGRNDHLFLVEAIDLNTGFKAVKFVYIKNLPIERYAPYFEKDSIIVNIEENKIPAEPLAQVHAISDNENLTYFLETPSEFFHINKDNGIIILKKHLDHESLTFHRIKVSAKGTITGKINETTININVIDKNDNAPYFTPENCPLTISVSLSKGNNRTLAYLTALDDDLLPKLKYTLLPANEEAFKYQVLFNFDQDSGRLSLRSENSKLFPDLPTSLNYNVFADDGLHSSTECKLNVKLFDFEISTKDKSSSSGLILIEDLNSIILQLNEKFQRVHQVRLISKSNFFNGTLTNCADDSSYLIENGLLKLSKDFDSTSCSLVKITLVKNQQDYQDVYVSFEKIRPNIQPEFINKDYIFTIYPEQYTLAENEKEKSLPLFIHLNNFDSRFFDLLIDDESQPFIINKENKQLLLINSIQRPSREQEGKVGVQFSIKVCHANNEVNYCSDEAKIMILFASENRFKHNYFPLIKCQIEKLHSQLRNANGDIIGSCHVDELSDNHEKSHWSLTGQDFLSIDARTGQVKQNKGLSNMKQSTKVVIHYRTENDDDFLLPYKCYSEINLEYQRENVFYPRFSSNSYQINMKDFPYDGQIIGKISAYDLDYNLNDPLIYYIDDGILEAQQNGAIRIIDSFALEKKLQSGEYPFQVSCKDSANQIATSIVKLNYHGKIKDSLKWNRETGRMNFISLKENTLLTEKDGIFFDFTQLLSVHNKTYSRYFLKDGNFTNELTLDQVKGHLKLIKPLDTEKYDGKNLSIKVVATDGYSDTQDPFELIISIEDVNDNVPICENENIDIQIKEDLEIGTDILKIIAKDNDVSEKYSKLSFILNSQHSSYFSIDSDTGLIKTTSALPQDTQKVELTISVSDVDNQTCETHVTITILDVNNHPPIFDIIDVSSIKEDAPVGNIIGYVHATDPDKMAPKSLKKKKQDDQHQLSYEIENASESRFSIHKKTGIISVSRPLDRETQAQHHLNITVKDSISNQHTTSTSVTVTLLDVNDSPPQFLDPNLTVKVSESLQVGSVITTVKAISLDEGDNAIITYRLITNQPEINLNSTSGEITLVKSLDYERSREYFLTIEASDSGVNPNRRSTVVTITVLDENDNAPQFHERVNLPFSDTHSNPENSNSITNPEMSENQCYHFKVYEGSKPSSLVGKIEATDLDSKEKTKLSYEFIDAPPSWLLEGTSFLTSKAAVPFLSSAKAKEFFSLDEDSGEIKLTVEPDREKISDYWFSVKVNDNSQPNEKSNITCVRVSILDINDEAPKFQNDSFEFILEVDREGNITAVQDENGEMVKINNMSTSKVLIGKLFVKDLDTVPNSGPFSCSLVSQSHANTQTNTNRYDYHSRLRQNHKSGQSTPFIVQSDKSDPDLISEGYCSIYSINQLNVGTHTLTIRVNDNGLTSMNSKTHVKIRVIRQTNVPPELIPTNATVILYNYKSLILNNLENKKNILSEPLAKIHVIDENLYKNKLKFEIIPKTQNSDLFTIDANSGKIHLANTVTHNAASSSTHQRNNFIDQEEDEMIDESSTKQFNLPKINSSDMVTYQSVLNKLNSGSYPLLVRVTNGTLSSEDYINIEVVSMTKEMLENAVVMRISSFIPNSFFVDKYDEEVKQKIAQAIGSDVSWEKDVRFLSVQPSSQLNSYPESSLYRNRRSLEKDAIDILLSVYRPKNREYMRAYQLEERINSISKELGRQLNADVTTKIDVCNEQNCKRGDCTSKIILANSDNPDENYNRVEVMKVNQLFPKFHLVPFCECPINYGGPNCDIPINECANAACPAPKVCVPIGMQGFTCVCPPPKSGPNCESSILLKSHNSDNLCDNEDCFSQREFGSLRFDGNSYMLWKLLDSKEKSFEISLKIQTKVKNSTLLMVNWDSLRKCIFEINSNGQLVILPSYLNSTKPNRNDTWFTSEVSIADGEEHKVNFQFSSLKDLDSDQLLAEALLKASQMSQVNAEDESDSVLEHLSDINNSLVNHIWSFQLSIDSLTITNQYLTWTPIDSKVISVFIGGLPNQIINPHYSEHSIPSISYERISLSQSFTGCIREILINGVKPPYQPHISPQQSIMLTMNTKRLSRLFVDTTDQFSHLNRISLLNSNNINYGACDKNWLTACELADCQNGGECRLYEESKESSKARCNCPSGFYDAKCSKVSNPCLKNPCQNGGACQKIENESILNSNYICRCKENFTGSDCEIPIISDNMSKLNLAGMHKNCDLMAKIYSSPNGYCLNGGTCQSSSNGIICLCPEGWKGTRCEVDINECDIVYNRLKKSQNHYSSTPINPQQDLTYDLCSWHGNSRGQCSNLEGSFSCNCSLGYTGRFCQIKNLASLNPDPNPFGLSQIQVYIIISLLAILFIGALVTILIITFKLCPCLGYDERNRYGLNPNRWFKLKMSSLAFKRKKEHQPFLEPGYQNGLPNGYHMHPSGSMMKLGGTMTPSLAGSQLQLSSYSQLPVAATPHTIGVNQSRFMFSTQNGAGGKKRAPLIMNPQMKNSQSSIMALSANGMQQGYHQIYVPTPSNGAHRPASTIDYRLDGGFENKSETASISSKHLIYNGGNRSESSMGFPMLVMQNSASNHHMFANSPTGSSMALHGAPPGAKIVYMPNSTGHYGSVHPVESTHHIDRLSLGSGSDHISNQGSQSCAIRRSIIQNGQVFYHPGSTQPTPLINNRQSIYGGHPQYILATDATGQTVAMPVMVNTSQVMTSSRTYPKQPSNLIENGESQENFDHDTIRPLHRGSNFYGGSISGIHHPGQQRYQQNKSYRRPSSVALIAPPSNELSRSDNQNGSQYSLSTDMPLANEVMEFGKPINRQYLPLRSIPSTHNSQWDLRRSKRLSMTRNSMQRPTENPYSTVDSQPLLIQANYDSSSQADVSMNERNSAFNMHTKSFVNSDCKSKSNSTESDRTENYSPVNETPKVAKKKTDSEDYDGTLRAKV